MAIDFELIGCATAKKFFCGTKPGIIANK